MKNEGFALSPVFGPVPSHRFEVTLGIDLLRMKTCTQDCVFCQLGCTTLKTEERLSFSLIEQVEKGLEQSRELLGLVKYVAFAGSGEPSLSLELGEAIRMVKKKTSLPVIVFTSAVLLNKDDVLDDVQGADILVVKLVSGVRKTYNAVVKPFNELSFNKYIDSISSLRANYNGTIWLDVILLRNINTTDIEIKAISSLIKKVNTEEVHLSLPTRPSGVSHKLFTPTDEEIARVCFCLGLKMDNPNSIAASQSIPRKDIREKMISIVTRRPCSIRELAKILSLKEYAVQKATSSIKEIEIVKSNDEEWVIPTPSGGKK